MMMMMMMMMMLLLLLVDRDDLAIVNGSHGVLSTGPLSARAAPRPTDRHRLDFLPSVYAYAFTCTRSHLSTVVG